MADEIRSLREALQAAERVRKAPCREPRGGLGWSVCLVSCCVGWLVVFFVGWLVGRLVEVAMCMQYTRLPFVSPRASVLCGCVEVVSRLGWAPERLACLFARSFVKRFAGTIVTVRLKFCSSSLKVLFVTFLFYFYFIYTDGTARQRPMPLTPLGLWFSLLICRFLFSGIKKSSRKSYHIRGER